MSPTDETQIALARLRDECRGFLSTEISRADKAAILAEINRLDRTLAELDEAVVVMLRQPGAIGLDLPVSIVGAVARHNQRTGATP